MILITTFLYFTWNKHKIVNNCVTIAKNDSVMVDSVSNVFFNRGFLHINNEVCIQGLHQNTIFIQDNMEEIQLDRIQIPFRLIKNKNSDTLYIFKNDKRFNCKLNF